MDLFLHSACLPFTWALGFMLFLSLYQIVGMLVGTQLPGSMEVPDLPELPGTGLGSILDWLNLGKVPIIVSLILWTWLFGAIGLIIQNATFTSVGIYLPKLVAVPVAFVGASAVLHWIIPPIARILPKDETSAINEDYVGRTAVITIGVARADLPAEARAQDRFGRNRYLRVVPDKEGESFEQGTEVLIVARKGNIHSAIRKD